MATTRKPLFTASMLQRSVHFNATLIGFSAVLMWGTLGPIAAALATLPTFGVNAVAFLIAFLVSAAYWRTRRVSFPALLRLPWLVWALGLYGLFGFHAFYFTAFRLAPAVDALLIVNLWPLLLVLISAAVNGDRLTAWHMAGSGLGFAGVATLVTRNGAAGFDTAHLAGYACALASALIWSSYSAFSRKLAAHIPSHAIGAFCGGTAALFFLAHAAFEPALAPSAREWVVLTFMGIAPMGIAFYTWNHGMRHGDVRLLGALSYLGPIIGTALLILLGLSPSDTRVVLAAALIVGGAALSSLGSRAQN